MAGEGDKQRRTASQIAVHSHCHTRKQHNFCTKLPARSTPLTHTYTPNSTGTHLARAVCPHPHHLLHSPPAAPAGPAAVRHFPAPRARHPPATAALHLQQGSRGRVKIYWWLGEGRIAHGKGASRKEKHTGTATGSRKCPAPPALPLQHSPPTKQTVHPPTHLSRTHAQIRMPPTPNRPPRIRPPT